MSALSILCSVAAHTKNHNPHPEHSEENIEAESEHARVGLSASDSTYYDSLKRLGILPQGGAHAGSQPIPKRSRSSEEQQDDEQHPGLKKRQKCGGPSSNTGGGSPSGIGRRNIESRNLFNRSV